MARRLWDKGYYDRVLRDSEATEAVAPYILANPVRAGLVKSIEDYPFLGSSIGSFNGPNVVTFNRIGGLKRNGF